MQASSPFAEFSDQALRSVDTPRPVHYINVLNTGDDALLARIHLVRAATRSTCIQTYIWANDETGRYLIYELIQAAQRGVQVRLLIDHFVAALSPEVTVELTAFLATVHPQLQAKFYNPAARFQPSAGEKVARAVGQFRELNQRMHNKVFVVDDACGITGGRNYENDYYDRGKTRNFKDRDVLVTGPVAAEMRASFDQYWSSEHSVSAKDLPDIAQAIDTGAVSHMETRESFELGDQFADLDRDASDSQIIRERLVDRTMQVADVRFVADPPGKNVSPGLLGGSVTGAELQQFLSQLDGELTMQSPYLVLDEAAVNAVKALRRENRQLDIRISTNSLAATDNLYAYSFAHAQRKQFVRDLRFRIFELQPVPGEIEALLPRYPTLRDRLAAERSAQGVEPQYQKANKYEYPDVHLCIHAKTFVVDDQRVWIGSFNLDPRSAHLNTEVALIISDEKVARCVRDNIERDMSPRNSWTIGKREKLPWRTFFSGLLGGLLKRTSLMKLWPFRYTESFELREGVMPVPWYHDDFYRNYQAVGPFPGVPENTREVEIGLVQAFGRFLKPII